VLYAQFQWSPNNEFLAYNGWTWGYKPNTFFEGNPNMSWFLPTPAQVKELNAYLDFNPKALFKGQVSGFNAQFNGYYGVHDIVHDNSFGGNNALHYRNEYCFLASRNTEDREAMIMLLDTHYQMKVIEARGSWSDDYYPLRPVRGWQYAYPLLSDIVTNTTL
jgi:hypothetical protein